MQRELAAMALPSIGVALCMIQALRFCPCWLHCSFAARTLAASIRSQLLCVACPGCSCDHCAYCATVPTGLGVPARLLHHAHSTLWPPLPSELLCCVSIRRENQRLLLSVVELADASAWAFSSRSAACFVLLWQLLLRALSTLNNLNAVFPCFCRRRILVSGTCSA